VANQMSQFKATAKAHLADKMAQDAATGEVVLLFSKCPSPIPQVANHVVAFLKLPDTSTRILTRRVSEASNRLGRLPKSRSMVMSDDGRRIKGKDTEVIDAAADALTVAATAAAETALGQVVGDGAVRDVNGSAAGDVNAAAEAVTAITARVAEAADGRVVADRGAVHRGGTGHNAKTAAPAVAAISARPTGTAQRYIGVERIAAERKQRIIREAEENGKAERDAAAYPVEAIRARAAGPA
jgi:phage gp45-like